MVLVPGTYVYCVAVLLIGGMELSHVQNAQHKAPVLLMVRRQYAWSCRLLRGVEARVRVRSRVVAQRKVYTWVIIL